ncbi:hypothetical protein V6N13_086487 [Hibiscus sabdariffa]
MFRAMNWLFCSCWIPLFPLAINWGSLDCCFIKPKAQGREVLYGDLESGKVAKDDLPKLPDLRSLPFMKFSNPFPHDCSKMDFDRELDKLTKQKR